jgi:hypothetical protein
MVSGVMLVWGMLGNAINGRFHPIDSVVLDSGTCLSYSFS